MADIYKRSGAELGDVPISSGELPEIAENTSESAAAEENKLDENPQSENRVFVTETVAEPAFAAPETNGTPTDTEEIIEGMAASGETPEDRLTELMNGGDKIDPFSMMNELNELERPE